ncbi:MAG: VOC family protein [Clostridiaceae bacterium]
MIIGMDHFTINIKNLDKSKYFYKEILELKELNTVDMGDHQLIYFQLEGDCKLELINYMYNTAVDHPKEDTKGIYRHMALRTDDVMNIYRKCIENNIFIRLHPTNMEKLFCTGMLIEDPNGVEIEIVEKYS